MTETADNLARERERALDRLRSLQDDFAGVVEASKDSNADDEHDPEGHTIAFERSQTSTLIRQAEQRLAEVEAARRRLADGTYGVCEVCSEPIAADRLDARPTARTCVAHVDG
ncbi:MAG: TraR/DksA family transcriptional regulator [Actinobacteria bacterium]|uniref:Unannotated protein n=1 Tax=freshwater metagenome TaxID=449393 RepID=A0A6J6P341_9ZZZZ|nr:TraR/DksA family transcriptional regulator [Actinomycetota bacterium]